MVNLFTFSKTYSDKNINLLSYLCSSNLNVADISFETFFIYIKSLVKKTPTTHHTYSDVQHNIMIR